MTKYVYLILLVRLIIEVNVKYMNFLIKPWNHKDKRNFFLQGKTKIATTVDSLSPNLAVGKFYNRIDA